MNSGTEGRERRGNGGWEDVLASEAHHVAPGAERRSELYRVALVTPPALPRTSAAWLNCDRVYP